MSHSYVAVSASCGFKLLDLMTNLSADDFRVMLQAVTQAAQSASDAAQALQALQSQQSSSTAAQVPTGDNFKEASRMVRQPDPFGSEDHESDLSKWQVVSGKFWI